MHTSLEHQSRVLSRGNVFVTTYTDESFTRLHDPPRFSHLIGRCKEVRDGDVEPQQKVSSSLSRTAYRRELEEKCGNLGGWMLPTIFIEKQNTDTTSVPASRRGRCPVGSSTEFRGRAKGQDTVLRSIHARPYFLFSSFVIFGTATSRSTTTQGGIPSPKQRVQVSHQSNTCVPPGTDFFHGVVQGHSPQVLACPPCSRSCGRTNNSILFRFHSLLHFIHAYMFQPHRCSHIQSTSILLFGILSLLFIDHTPHLHNKVGRQLKVGLPPRRKQRLMHCRRRRGLRVFSFPKGLHRAVMKAAPPNCSPTTSCQSVLWRWGQPELHLIAPCFYKKIKPRHKIIESCFNRTAVQHPAKGY